MGTDKGIMLYYVQRGVNLLDEEVPGWETMLDLDALDMHNPSLCVVGQIFRGRYSQGLNILLGVSASRVPSEYGFDSPGLFAFGNPGEELFNFAVLNERRIDYMEDLNAEWRRVVNNRLNPSRAQIGEIENV